MSLDGVPPASPRSRARPSAPDGLPARAAASAAPPGAAGEWVQLLVDAVHYRRTQIGLVLFVPSW